MVGGVVRVASVARRRAAMIKREEMRARVR